MDFGSFAQESCLLVHFLTGLFSQMCMLCAAVKITIFSCVHFMCPECWNVQCMWTVGSRKCVHFVCPECWNVQCMWTVGSRKCVDFVCPECWNVLAVGNVSTSCVLSAGMYSSRGLSAIENAHRPNFMQL